MTRDGTRRHESRPADRGQTLHDYVAGISVFIVTITVVLGLLPGVLAPYQADGNVADTTRADRISDRLVSNLSTASAPNIIDSEEISTVLDKSNAELQTRFGLEEYQNVNVSVKTLNGSAFVVDPFTGGSLTAGANDAGNSNSASARIISLSDPPSNCRPACRLIVKVW